NEGANRIYAAVRGSGVREYSFDDVSGWTQTSEIPIDTVFSLAIGDGRNDGVIRLYMAGQYDPPRVFEATFDGSQWQTSLVGTPGQYVFKVRVGDARGDGVNRVYSSGIGGVYEFTHPYSKAFRRGVPASSAGN